MKKLLYKIAILLVLVFAISASFYFYVQYRNAQKLLKNPTLVASEEAKELIAKVAVLIELPKGEDPTIATVSDINKLADQPFFANAKNGDKLLAYTRSNKLILYRPSLNKIIDVAPVSSVLSQVPAKTTASTTPTPTLTPALSPTLAPKIIKVVVYNGTKIAGLASTTGEQLMSKITSLEVVKKADATGNYTSTLIVDLTGQSATVAKQIATILNGKVGTLPTNEVKPTADILVIVGK